MFIDILKSLVIPSKMKKYRYMSCLIAMLIFIAAIYLTTLPYGSLINRKKETYLQEKTYVSAYYDMGDDLTEGYQKIKDANYKVVDGVMVSSKETNEKEVVSYTYMKNEEVITTHLVFDITNSVTTELDELKKEFLELHPSFSSGTAMQVSQLVYIKLLKDSTLDKNVLFTEYSGYEQEKIQEEIDKVSNFDLFGITHNPNDYLIGFFKEYMISQIPYEENEKIIYPSLTASYSSNSVEIDFSDITNVHDIGRKVCNGLFNTLKANDKNQNLLQALGYIILYPTVLIILMWFSMRKRGNLKTFKEYYNVASIASIVPTIITFILAWFIPGAVMAYGILFSIMVLFAYISINSKPELGD